MLQDERASAGLLTVSAVETAVEGEGEQQETNTRAVELCQKLEQRDTDANRLTVDRLLQKRLHMADFSRVVRDEVGKVKLADFIADYLGLASAAAVAVLPLPGAPGLPVLHDPQQPACLH